MWRRNSSSRAYVFPPPALPPYTAMSAGVDRKWVWGPFWGRIVISWLGVSSIVGKANDDPPVQQRLRVIALGGGGAAKHATDEKLDGSPIRQPGILMVAPLACLLSVGKLKHPI